MNAENRLDRIDEAISKKKPPDPAWAKDAGTAVIMEDGDTHEAAIERFKRNTGRNLKLLHRKDDGMPNILFVTIAK